MDSSNCCPWAETFWSSTSFRVSNAKGGAISANGPNHVTIRDTEFRANEADNGASLSLASTLTVRITNVTIDEPTDEQSTAVATFGTSIDSCVENACDLGSSCTFRDHSTFCDACGPNEKGVDGISCAACQPGTQPDALQTECAPCASGQYSQIGVCISCSAGKTSSADRTGCIPCEPGTYRSADEPSCTQCTAGSQPNEPKTACERCIATGQNTYSPDGRECKECPARNAPNDDHTDCFCQANTYSAGDFGLITCRGTSFRSDGMESDECAVCPACLDCDVGETTLKSGWAFFGAAGEAYRCPGADKFEACPPLLLNDNTTDHQPWPWKGRLTDQRLTTLPPG
eukprot:COSAG04_NODE_5226_length_1695_cov_1.250627_2_plen_344_part_00